MRINKTTQVKYFMPKEREIMLNREIINWVKKEAIFWKRILNVTIKTKICQFKLLIRFWECK